LKKSKGGDIEKMEIFRLELQNNKKGGKRKK